MTSPSRADTGIVVLAAVLALAVGVLELVHRPTLVVLTSEDGLVEYSTALLFLVAGVIFLATALRRPVSRVWAVVMGVGCVVVAGEEVSWGQRLLGLTTPEVLVGSNVQQEINLHNLDVVHGVVRAAAVLVLVGVFVVLPLLAAWWPWLRRSTRRLRVPVPPLVAIPVLVIGLVFMVVPRVVTGGAVFRLDEVGEAYVALLALLYALSAWRTSGRDGSPGSEVGTGPAAPTS